MKNSTAVASAHPVGVKNASDATEASTVLAADVGGTFARLAWVTLIPGEAPVVRNFQKYACAEYPSLASILSEFSAETAPDLDAPSPSSAVVAIAGLLEGDHLLNTNLPWQVSVASTTAESGLEHLQLINDFQAMAYAIPHADPRKMNRLAGSGDPLAGWPALILGPGTGLGAALRLGGEHTAVLSSEIGHSALAAGNELELDVVRLLMRRYGHVDNERVLSGPGLVNLYGCLCELRGASPQWGMPQQLIEAAQSGQDPIAEESLHVFCEWLGSLVGDLAIAFGAKAVYLSGGITSHITEFLHDGRFQQRYLRKGALSAALQQVSVWRVDHGQLGVIGAAAWYAEHR
ncbi:MULTISPECIES: glucokinase [unclassified Pseudoxanthomonas]|uniref:glucokinase n=1 Tax=unclassified Pseudoxanthomonas TaxID=2645906 RepID=UPI003076BF92